MVSILCIAVRIGASSIGDNILTGMNTKHQAVLTAIAQEQECKVNMHPDHAISSDVAKKLMMPTDEVHGIALELEKAGKIEIRPTMNYWGYRIRK